MNDVYISDMKPPYLNNIFQIDFFFPEKFTSLFFKCKRLLMVESHQGVKRRWRKS